MSDEDPQILVRTLPFLVAPIEAAPLPGGGSAKAFKVRDAKGVYAVRIGRSLGHPSSSRRRQEAAQRAAHAAGLAPRVVYARDDVLACDFIEGRALTAADLRRRIETLVMILRRCHLHVGKRLRGEAAAAWVFHTLRNCAQELAAANHPLSSQGLRLRSIIETLEEAQAPMRMVFGHADLTPDNFLDDGERLWLIDWERAGFGAAVFDLANLSANAAFSDADDKVLLETYFGASPTADVMRSFAAMKAASAMRDAMEATIAGLRPLSHATDRAGDAARKTRRFEALYAAFRDRF
ncbi:MAG: phosphotransferase [Hyphomicrobiales bacterium]|nr:phosphotransferase [Hyphomicrobiales bacterium]